MPSDALRPFSSEPTRVGSIVETKIVLSEKYVIEHNINFTENEDGISCSEAHNHSQLRKERI